MKAKDDRSNEYPFIKQGHPYRGSEYISDFEYFVDAPNLYDTITLDEELKRIASFIKKYTEAGKQSELHFHLPWKDYILFAVTLYLKGRMPLDVLGKFCWLVSKHKKQYEDKIKEVCVKHNIKVTILSPFDNVFDLRVLQEKATPQEMAEGGVFLAKRFLRAIGLNLEQVLAKEPRHQQKFENDEQRAKFEAQEEDAFVKHCLNRLRTPREGANKRHQLVWSQFLTEQECQTIQRLETDTDDDKCTPTLLRIGNAFTLAEASYNKPHNKVASFLNLEEGSIQRNYKERLKFLQAIKERADKLKIFKGKKTVFTTKFDELDAQLNTTLKDALNTLKEKIVILKNDGKTSYTNVMLVEALVTALEAVLQHINAPFSDKSLKTATAKIAQLEQALKDLGLRKPLSNLKEKNKKATDGTLIDNPVLVLQGTSILDNETIYKIQCAPKDILLFEKTRQRLQEVEDKIKDIEAYRETEEEAKYRDNFPDIVTFTTIPSLMALRSDEVGSLYYFNGCNTTLDLLIKERRLLDAARQNLMFFARGETQRIGLEEVLVGNNPAKQFGQ